MDAFLMRKGNIKGKQYLNYCRKSYTINATMKTELKKLILQKAKEKELKAFSCYDFTDLGSYKTISKCLERLEDAHEVKRIIQGVYSLNLFDDVLNLPILPSIDDVVNCIARKHKWTICPTGNTALNVMGLSNQVPASYSYLTTGPYKNYIIYKTPVVLKRTMTREIIDYSYKTLLLIQCIKAIGRNNITEKEINILKKNMNTADKSNSLKETQCIQAWIRNIIVMICKE